MKSWNEKMIQNINLILTLSFGLLKGDVTYILVGAVISITITLYFKVPVTEQSFPDEN